MRFYFRLREQPIKRLKTLDTTRTIPTQQTTTSSSYASGASSTKSVDNPTTPKATATASKTSTSTSTSSSTSVIRANRNSTYPNNNNIKSSVSLGTLSKTKAISSSSVSTTSNNSKRSFSSSIDDHKQSTSYKKQKTGSSIVSSLSSKLSSKFSSSLNSSTISSTKPQLLTDAKLLQFQKNASAKQAISKATEHRKNMTLSKNLNTSSKTSSSNINLSPALNRSSNVSSGTSKNGVSFNMRNLIDTRSSLDTSASTDCKTSSGEMDKGGNNFLSISSIIDGGSGNAKGLKSSSDSKTEAWKVSNSSSGTSSKSSASGSPLSPPPLRIKFTTSPTTNSSSGSSSQIIGQIISPKPLELMKESSKSLSPSTAKSNNNNINNPSVGQPQYKTVTSQGVQSTPFPSLPLNNGNQQRQRGQMIHHIIDKMQSKGSFKSTNVNVTSTTPSLDQLISGSSSTSSKESSPAPSSPQPSSTTTTNTTTLSVTTISSTKLNVSSTDESIGDNKVTTTTGDNSPMSNTSPSGTSPKSSGNLVLRISTKSLDLTGNCSNSTSNGKMRHNSTSSEPSSLTSAALSPSSLDSNCSAGSKKNPKSSFKKSPSIEVETDNCETKTLLVFGEQIKKNSMVESTMVSPKNSTETSVVTIISNSFTTSTPQSIGSIDLLDNDSSEEPHLVMDIDANADDESTDNQINTRESTICANTSVTIDSESSSLASQPIINSTNSVAEISSKSTLPPISVHSGLNSPPQTPSPKSSLSVTNSSESSETQSKSNESQKLISSATVSKPSGTSNFPLDLSKKTPSPPAFRQAKLSPTTLSKINSPALKINTDKIIQAVSTTQGVNRNTSSGSSKAPTITLTPPLVTQSSASSLRLVSPKTAPKSTSCINHTSTLKRPYSVGASCSAQSKVQAKEINIAAQAARDFFPITPSLPATPVQSSSATRVSYPPYFPTQTPTGFDMFNMNRGTFSAPDLPTNLAQMAMIAQIINSGNATIPIPNGSSTRIGKSMKDRIVPSSSSKTKRNGVSNQYLGHLSPLSTASTTTSTKSSLSSVMNPNRSSPSSVRFASAQSLTMHNSSSSASSGRTGLISPPMISSLNNPVALANLGSPPSRHLPSFTSFR